MFFEHPQPARRIFLHTQRFVINRPVVYGLLYLSMAKMMRSMLWASATIDFLCPLRMLRAANLSFNA